MTHTDKQTSRSSGLADRVFRLVRNVIVLLSIVASCGCTTSGTRSVSVLIDELKRGELKSGMDLVETRYGSDWAETGVTEPGTSVRFWSCVAKDDRHVVLIYGYNAAKPSIFGACAIVFSGDSANVIAETWFFCDAELLKRYIAANESLHSHLNQSDRKISK